MEVRTNLKLQELRMAIFVDSMQYVNTVKKPLCLGSALKKNPQNDVSSAILTSNDPFITSYDKHRWEHQGRKILPRERKVNARQDMFYVCGVLS